MKNITFLIGFCSFSAFSQYIIPRQKDTISEVEKQSIGIISQSDTLSKSKFNHKKGELVLKDFQKFEKYDNAWLKELSDKNPYSIVYQDVQADYSQDVQYDQLPTELLKQRLQKLSQRTLFRIEYNPIIERIIKSFLKNRRSSLTRHLTVSQYYFPMFEQELNKQNLPLELKYLPIIESALNPRATSPVGAKGLWQFMFYTGKMYDLNVSNYVDERADPVKATKAAAQFLRKLYDMYGDWELVLAAYNSGPGNVNKAIRRSGGKTNYWNIRQYLPRETAGYVPAFLATLYIFEYAKEHGLKPEPRSNIFFETDTIQVKKHMPFSVISSAIGISEDELEFLNPSYKRNIVPYIEGSNYSLRLPMDLVPKFVNNEQAIYDYIEAEENNREKIVITESSSQYSSSNVLIHRVRRGESIGKIAKKYGVTINSIKKANHLRSNKVKVGQRLKIKK